MLIYLQDRHNKRWQLNKGDRDSSGHLLKPFEHNPERNCLVSDHSKISLCVIFFPVFASVSIIYIQLKIVCYLPLLSEETDSLPATSSRRHRCFISIE